MIMPSAYALALSGKLALMFALGLAVGIAFRATKQFLEKAFNG